MTKNACRIISIASGKGGVGKTSFTLNFAWRLAMKGKRVCLLDADLGMANIDVILNLNPTYTLDNVLFEDVPMEKALIEFTGNLDIIPGGSGVARMAALNRAQRERLFTEFGKLNGYDYLLIDNSPGVIPSVISFCVPSKEVMVIVTPEATALTDGFALIKVLYENGLSHPPLLIVNKSTQKMALNIFERMRSAAKKHLGKGIIFLGGVPNDPRFQEEFRHHIPVTGLFPSSAVTAAIDSMIDRLNSRPNRDHFLVSPEEFWEKTVTQSRSRAPLPLLKEAPESPVKPTFEDCISSLGQHLESMSGNGDLQTQELLKMLDRLAIQVEMARSRMREAAAAAARRKEIGLICSDTSMINLLRDLLSGPKYQAVDLLSEPAKATAISGIIFCMDRADERLGKLNGHLSRVPSIYLSGFSPQPLSILPRDLSIHKIIRKPFRLQEIYNAVEEITTEGAGKTDA
jgi:MinD-like ATPase involved in chromosome partitioning or flagellar assembly